MPLYRRLPKRGFLPYGGKTEFAIVNVGELSARFAAGSVVDPETLVDERADPASRAAARSRSWATATWRTPSRCASTRSARRPSRSSRRRVAASSRWPPRARGPASDRRAPELPEHLQGSGAQAPRPHDAGAARRLPAGRPRAHPGHRRGGPRRVLQPGAGHPARHGGPLLGGQPAAPDRVRARDHAVHLGLDHPAAPHGGHSGARAAGQGRRGGEEEDHPVHPLRHHRALARAVLRHRGGPREHAEPDRRHPGPGSGLGLPAHDHAHPDHRDRPDHVAGRADLREGASATASP